MYVFKTAYTSLAAMQAATGQEANGVQADPQFVAKATGDLQLTEGSPAIDRGDSGGLRGAGPRRPRQRPGPTTQRRQHPRHRAAALRRPRRLRVPARRGRRPDGADRQARRDPDHRDGSARRSPPTPSASHRSAGPGAQLRASTGVTAPRTGSQGAATATHTYPTAGTYTVKVTVTDTAGLTDTATQTVTVDAAPKAPVARADRHPDHRDGTRPGDRRRRPAPPTRRARR